MRQGFWPDTLSTDLHQLSVAGHNLVEDQAFIGEVRGDGSPELTLLTVMTKFLYLGWSTRDVIRAVTSSPAATFGWSDIGTLRVGSLADVAILEVAEGARELYDIEGNVRPSTVASCATRRSWAGAPMDPKPIPAPPPWIRLVDVEAGRVERASA